MPGVLRVFLNRLLRRGRFEREMAEELRFHLEARAADLERGGMSPAMALRQARMEFGGVEQYKESLRAGRPGAAFGALAQDVRLSARRLRQEPAFALAVAVTLSLGIGASTAVFGILRVTSPGRIPFPGAGSLAIGCATRNGAGAGSVSGFDYFDYREFNRSFESLAAFYLATFNGPPTVQTVTGLGDPWAEEAGYVSWNLFRTLGVRPLAGRDFLPEEELEAGAPPAILSFGLWQRAFGGLPDAVGRAITLNGVPHTVVGVMPRGFRFHRDVDVWRVAVRRGEARHLHNYHLVGRLKPGVPLEQAQADVDAISRALAGEYPKSNKDKGLRLMSLEDYLAGDVRAGLPLPAAAAACLLLIACANVAGLLLARGQRRLPEMAMRASLGASRGRLVRQSLTETAVLALPAAALGAGVAFVLQEMLLHLLPVGALGVSEPLIDGSVLAFALAASLAAGLAAGLVPAIRGTAVSLSAHIGTGRQACEPAHGARLRGGLVIAQIAVSAALLVGAGLVARSLLRLSAVDVGFPADKILAARIEVPLSAYRDGAKRQAFFAAVLRDVEALPGVVAAGTATQAPLLDPRNIWATRPPGRVLSGSDLGELTRLRHVSPGYFGALNLPLLQGRGIPDSGPGAAEKVAVVSESLARRLYPGSDPVGRTVLLMDNLSSPPRELPYEIVGVAGDIRLSDPREAGSPTLYLPVSLANPNRLRLVVRAAGDPGGLAGPIRDIVRRLDRDALVTDVLTMDAAVEGASSSLRRVARYLGLFAGLSLLLAASGLYGALAYHVSRQEHEIGVRLAMGASRAGILRLVLRRGTALASAGLLLGLAAAWPGARLVESLLYETGTLDPVTYLGAVLLLGLAAASACFLPALRAARTDPALLLKSE